CLQWPAGLRVPFADFPNEKACYSMARRLTIAVIADGFHWAPLHRFFTQTFLLRVLRLLVNVRVTTIIVARKIRWRRLATKVAIDALIIHVKLASHILWILVCNVSHNSLCYLVSDSKRGLPRVRSSSLEPSRPGF